MKRIKPTYNNFVSYILKIRKLDWSCFVYGSSLLTAGRNNIGQLRYFKRRSRIFFFHFFLPSFKFYKRQLIFHNASWLALNHQWLCLYIHLTAEN